jgi:hypothetical protein
MVEHTGLEPVTVCSPIDKKRLFSVLCGLFDMPCPRLKIQSVTQNVTQLEQLFEQLKKPPRAAREAKWNNYLDFDVW